MPRRPHVPCCVFLYVWTNRNGASLTRKHPVVEELVNDPSSRSRKSGCRQMTASTSGVPSEWKKTSAAVRSVHSLGNISQFKELSLERRQVFCEWSRGMNRLVLVM